MKRYFSFLIAVLFPLTSLAPVVVRAAHIEDTTASSTPKEIRVKITETQKKRVVELARAAADKLVATSDKQAGLIVRIDARARKFEETGHDVETAKQKISAMKASFEVARSLIDAILDNVDEVLAYGSYKDALTEAKLSITDAQTAVLATHKKIGDAIDALEVSASEQASLSGGSEQ